MDRYFTVGQSSMSKKIGSVVCRQDGQDVRSGVVRILLVRGICFKARRLATWLQFASIAKRLVGAGTTNNYIPTLLTQQISRRPAATQRQDFPVTTSLKMLDEQSWRAERFSTLAIVVVAASQCPAASTVTCEYP